MTTTTVAAYNYDCLVKLNQPTAEIQNIQVSRQKE